MTAGFPDIAAGQDPLPAGTGLSPIPREEGSADERTRIAEQKEAEMRGGGGIGHLLLFKLLGIVAFFIILGMVLVPTLGGAKTASLYGNLAVDGGLATGITGASLPIFAGTITKGWNMVSPGGVGDSGPAMMTSDQVKKKPAAKPKATPKKVAKKATPKVPNCTKAQKKAAPSSCA